jgi:hypothetical protein
MSVDNEVGYKKPPKANQFKKGQSGNPKGRPKGSRSISAAFEEVIWKSVRIRQGDQRKSVPMIQAMLMALMAKATQPDIKAADLILKFAERFQHLTPKSALAPASASTSKPFEWTEEDESLRPFLEGLGNKQIFIMDGDNPIGSGNPGTPLGPEDESDKKSDTEQNSAPEKPT